MCRELEHNKARQARENSQHANSDWFGQSVNTFDSFGKDASDQGGLDGLPVLLANHGLSK